MKIGIICLANGPYKLFIGPMMDSITRYLLPNYQKHFFIITDGEFDHDKNENCTVILKQRNGLPLDCLYRSKYAYELREQTRYMDYLYFFNANVLICSKIGEEFLPDEGGLVGVDHPEQCISRDVFKYPYDRNPKTHAYIPLGDGHIYYQAFLWGGATEPFMELSKTINEWTDDDISKGTMPSILDESYLNKYFEQHKPKLLPSNFAYPLHSNGSEYSFKGIKHPKQEIKIIQLIKTDYIDNGTEAFKYI